MAKNRKPREEIKAKNFDLLKPLDVLSLGGEGDPCFGKYHDLKAKECAECGDSEFCAIVKAQNLHKERLEVESKQRFKDMEEAEDSLIKKKKEAKRLISKYISEGKKRMKTILLVAEKTNLTKSEVKSLYDN